MLWSDAGRLSRVGWGRRPSNVGLGSARLVEWPKQKVIGSNRAQSLKVLLFCPENIFRNHLTSKFSKKIPLDEHVYFIFPNSKSVLKQIGNPK